MNRYALHSEAFTDIDGIWEYIAEHNIDAADGVVDDIFAALRAHRLTGVQPDDRHAGTPRKLDNNVRSDTIGAQGSR